MSVRFAARVGVGMCLFVLGCAEEETNAPPIGNSGGSFTGGGVGSSATRTTGDTDDDTGSVQTASANESDGGTPDDGATDAGSFDESGTTIIGTATISSDTDTATSSETATVSETATGETGTVSDTGFGESTLLTGISETDDATAEG